MVINTKKSRQVIQKQALELNQTSVGTSRVMRKLEENTLFKCLISHLCALMHFLSQYKEMSKTNHIWEKHQEQIRFSERLVDERRHSSVCAAGLICMRKRGLRQEPSFRKGPPLQATRQPASRPHQPTSQLMSRRQRAEGPRKSAR